MKRTTPHDKDLFLTGEYIQYFTPDDKWNPFRRIYRQKKQDTIRIINERNGTHAILDIGGGMGRISLALAESERNKVVLADVSIDMLKLVETHAVGRKRMRRVNADAHSLPFADGSFDIVVGLDLLCHLQKPEIALREFHRVLTSRGMLILDSTNSNPLWALFYPRYMGKNPLNWYKIMKFKGNLPGWETIVKHYPKERFYGLLQDTGFNVVRSLHYGPIICPKWHLAVSMKVG